MTETVMGIPLFGVKSLDKYWANLEDDLERFRLGPLQRKYEYGTSYMCSERGIQLSLAYYAEKIAQKQGINVDKTKSICLAVGVCFPQFGTYGMAACEKYISKKNMSYDMIDIRIGAIEYYIDQMGGIITPQFDEALHAYYKNQTNIPEVNVARYCQIKIKESRELMKNGTAAGEAISKVMDGAVDCFPVEKSIMMESGTDIDIPAEVQETVDKNLDELIEFHGLPEGIFEYIIYL